MEKGGEGKRGNRIFDYFFYVTFSVLLSFCLCGAQLNGEHS